MKQQCQEIIFNYNHERLDSVECHDTHGLVANAECRETKNYVEIMELFVNRGQRKRSYGSQLIRAIQQYAKKKRKPVVLIAQSIDGVGLKQLVAYYKRFGFVAEDVSDDGSRCVNMEWSP